MVALAKVKFSSVAAEREPARWQTTHVGATAAPTWTEIDAELRRLARDQRAHDAEEARWLVAGRAAGVHLHQGMATYLEYLERVLGYPPRLAAERLRVAEALAHLPALAAALAAGSQSWSAVRELSRVAVPATEREWLAAASGRTVRDIESLVAGRRLGDRPGDPIDPTLVRKVIRLELSAPTYALFREACQKVQQESGASLSDDEALAAVCRAALGGPDDAGRASHQIAVTVCPRCEQATVDGAGASLPIPAARLDQARCDAQAIGATNADAPQRATQTIPPAIRRLVVRRDHGRCRVDGCRAARFVEVHHIVPRADGGTHDPSGLLVLCDAHHRAVHDGRLRIEGTVAAGLRFLHADGRPYGSPAVLDAPPVAGPAGAAPSPEPRAVEATVEGSLRRLGFAAAEARAAVSAARAHVGAAATVTDLLRAALQAVPLARAAR